MTRTVTFNIPKEFIVTREAGAALADGLRFLQEAASGKVVYCADGEGADFILLYPAEIGAAATCVRPGCDVPLEAGVALASGGPVASGADGVGRVPVPTDIINGYVTNTTVANAGGEEITLKFAPKGQVAAV